MRGSDRAYRPDAAIVPELASGAVVVRDRTLLLLHHTEERRWCLPKGHVDPGESLGTAAMREVREETGLSEVTLGPELGEVSYRFYHPKRQLNVYKSCVYFLARSPHGEPVLEPTFDQFTWATVDGALSLVPFETDRRVIEMARPALAESR